jgi:SAM-dependent methyltransferase
MVVDYGRKVKRIFLRPYNFLSYPFGVWRPSCDTMSIENALLSLIEELERDCSLHEPQQLRRRVEALDDLDACLSGGEVTRTELDQRAEAIHSKLESLNYRAYEGIRRHIQTGGGARSLLEWMPDWNRAADLLNRKGYDYLDELISGVLRLEEPSADIVRLESEMVPYQPTPARHIFDLIDRTALTERDFLIDLGCGLGHVALIASICTRANCIGVECELSYVHCARNSARSLSLNNVKFVHGDARSTDLSKGTVFYLYTPFSGSILRDVLNSLRRESLRREIRICTFGPCTGTVAHERWLSVIGAVEAERIAIFRSRDYTAGWR